MDRLLGGVQIRLELFRARDARAGIALQRARRLPLLRGVLLELFHTRLRGRESLGLGAALMLRGLECAGPVLRLAPRAGPLLLELAEPAPFRREGRLELRIPRAHLGERLFVSSGRRRGGGRCGAHLGERLGELGALGPEPRELALLPRVAAALPDGDAGRRTRALAGGIGLGARRGGALARRAARILLRSAQLRVALGQRGGERARLLFEAGDAGSALRELGLQFARARVTADHRPRDARQLALALLALALQIPDELFENPPAALGALQRLDETEHALALLAQIVHRACGAGAILREALLMLRVLIALQARCALELRETALQIVGARSRRAHQGACLRELLLEVRACTGMLIELKGVLGLQLCELVVELRGATLGRRARLERLVAGVLDLPEPLVLTRQQPLCLAQPHGERLHGAVAVTGLGGSRSGRRLRRACAGKRRRDPRVGGGRPAVPASRVRGGLQRRQLGRVLDVGFALG